MPVNKPLISVRDLEVTYFPGKSNEVRALKHVNLDIYPGEFIIFFGPSGCGKSTLLYSIAGLERNATGKITVADQDVVTLSDKGLEKFHQKTIGMIFQAFYLIPSLTVLKNVTVPQIAIGGNVKEREAKAQQLLDHFGVGAQANKLPTELSGGQQQRVAISRSLINDPDIIMADEPVGNLDSKSSHDVIELIQNLNEKEKKAVILVTHDPSHIDIADKVFYMKDGEVIRTEVNAHPRRHGEAVTAETVKDAGAGKNTSQLQILAETFPGITEHRVGQLLVEYAARQMVLETLTGFHSEHIERIEQFVMNYIRKGVKDKGAFLKYLDTDELAGGLGMNKKAAVALVKKLRTLVEEVTFVSKSYKRRNDKKRRTIVQLRQYLFDTFDIHVRGTKAVDAVDAIIRERMEGDTDYRGVVSKLDLSIREKGAGLDRRDAKRVAERLELILLGRFTVAELASDSFNKRKVRKEKKVVTNKASLPVSVTSTVVKKASWFSRVFRHLFGKKHASVSVPKKRKSKSLKRSKITKKKV